MTNFWTGFIKRGYEPQVMKPQEPGLLSRMAVPGAALATGLGAYAALRRGKKTNLIKTMIEPKKSQTPFRTLYNKITHGADEIKYVNEGAELPRRAQKIKGTVFHGQPETAKFYTGNRNYVENSKDMDKKFESSLLRRNAPQHHIQSKALSTVHKGRRGLQQLHKTTPFEDYLIKPSKGFNSGVGGENFAHKSDVEAYLSGGKLNKRKLEAIKKIQQDPTGHLMQENAGILKGKLSGKNREFRVHVLDGKVIRGATSPRGGNFEDVFNSRKMEKEVQKVIDRLPAKYKARGTGINPDIAMTKDGPKIIELNTGLSSGLMDPEYQLAPKKLRGFGGKNVVEKSSKNYIGFANAVKNNMAMYKHITGRSHILPATLKSTAAAAGTYGAGSYLKRKSEENG